MGEENRQETEQNTGLVWKDRKHWMWFPFSFTKYRIEDGRLYERKKESEESGRTAGKGGDRS